ncbi:MAG: FAD:protein FMN transferase [Lachnospiraceae bacterium]|nr:FAD:protein FMN transferase [Lachnospiraceae bacterium]
MPAALAVTAALLLALSGNVFAAAALQANAAEEKTSSTGFFLDTVVTITLYGDTDSAAMDGCFELLEQYEQMLSRTIEGSDVWNINHSAGESTTVNEETAALIETALEYSQLTDSAFDITITPLVELWDIDGKSELLAGVTDDSSEESIADSLIPSEEEIASALSHIDDSVVSVDENIVTLSDPEAEIDLGGIAKGYIADCLKEYLLSQGIEHALINLGGNVLTVGTKSDGSAWKIGIQEPFGESSDVIAVVACADKSVVTSGTYERYFEVDGRIYHHILDPNTGYPVDNGLTSVTILSDSSTTCDALSTACFVLGLEDGMELIESLENIEALFITEDETLYRTSGFPE